MKNKNKNKRRTIIFLNSLIALMYIRFSFSKIIGLEVSRKGFEEMASTFSKIFFTLDSNFFRSFVGYIELLVGILIIVSTLFLILKRSNALININSIAFFSLSIMGGALFSEFFLRNEPKTFLVIIAIIVSLLNAITIFLNNNLKIGLKNE